MENKYYNNLSLGRMKGDFDGVIPPWRSDSAINYKVRQLVYSPRLHLGGGRRIHLAG
jgi:hypothetical protein